MALKTHLQFENIIPGLRFLNYVFLVFALKNRVPHRWWTLAKRTCFQKTLPAMSKNITYSFLSSITVLAPNINELIWDKMWNIGLYVYHVPRSHIKDPHTHFLEKIPNAFPAILKAVFSISHMIIRLSHKQPLYKQPEGPKNSVPANGGWQAKKFRAFRWIFYTCKLTIWWTPASAL